MALAVKSLLASAGDVETQAPSLGWEDPLEEEMVTQSSILDWSIPWTEEPGELQSMGSQKSWTRLSDQTTIGQVCVAGLGMLGGF